MTKREVQMQLAEILMDFTGDTAYARLEEAAKEHKKSVNEMARRMASNLLSSLSLERPVLK